MFDAHKVKGDIVKWISDYFSDCAHERRVAVVGISGGKDSSVVAALCKEAIGRERVLGVLMPNGRQEDIDVSYDLCKLLEINYFEINIGNSVDALFDSIRLGGLEKNSAAVINTPARIRMTTLYAVSAIVGGRVANTCNLSEDWVGYSTKFGDQAGDFSPISRLTVSEVKAIGYQLALDSKFIDKPPADGLSGKADEDNLGFSYSVLDKYIREGVCLDDRVKTRIDSLHKQNLHKLNPMPFFSYKPE